MAATHASHVLYHFDYSICSIMVRYAIALRGQAKDEKHETNVEEKETNIWRREQLTEHFLCDINPCGEVPVLAPADSTETIPDSLEITKYLAKSYPSLIPDSQADEINRLLSELHSLNYFSLSFTGNPAFAHAVKTFLNEQLASDISDRYREAIKFKIKRIDTNKIGGLEPDVVKANEEKAQSLMKEFESILSKSSTGYLLGLDRPSALDAHLVVFIARLFDVERGGLVSAKLKEYAEKAMKSDEWNSVMQGRSTSSKGSRA